MWYQFELADVEVKALRNCNRKKGEIASSLTLKIREILVELKKLGGREWQGDPFSWPSRVLHLHHEFRNYAKAFISE